MNFIMECMTVFAQAAIGGLIFGATGLVITSIIVELLGWNQK